MPRILSKLCSLQVRSLTHAFLAILFVFGASTEFTLGQDSDVVVAQKKPIATTWNESAINYLVNTILGDELSTHARTLADDTMEGREAGSAGGRAAGNYLLRLMAQHQLQPAGNQQTYIQSFGDNYRNLLGYIEGSDPELKNEFILIGAHYDHVGYGNTSNSRGGIGSIHNGADDNASGTSALIEMIEAMNAVDARPARSLLFVFWDGEEKGLLGSKHWVRNPTIDLSQVKLMINLDMIGRLKDSGLEVYGSQTAAGLRRMTSLSNQDQVKLVFNWDLKEDSDHYPFAQNGVPILMLHTGLHEQYHRPSDDPETLNVSGMQDVTRMALRIALMAADGNTDLRFRNVARNESEATRRRMEELDPKRPGRLGVTVDRDSRNGVLLTDVKLNGPAAIGGLKANDFLLKLDDIELSQSEDLIRALVTAPASVTFTLVRDGETIQEEVRLSGQPMRIGLSWRPDVSDASLMFVTEVVRGSAAEVGGLKTGDRIYEFNGQPFENSSSLLDLFAEAEGEIELLIEREGRLKYLLMDIGSAE